MTHNTKKRISKSHIAHQVRNYPKTDETNLEHKKVKGNPWLDGTFSHVDFKRCAKNTGHSMMVQWVGNEQTTDPSKTTLFNVSFILGI